jgi:hypothetical protein
MLSTEIEHLLGFADRANPGTAQLTTLHQQTENLNRGRFGRGSHQRHSAVALEQVEVNIQVVVGGNSVQNEVKAVDVFLHLRFVLRDDNFIRAQPLRVG